jgi:hypothetical protein
VQSIAILIPTARVGTGIYQPNNIFLIEEIIAWLAGVGPKNAVIRLYNRSTACPLVFAELATAAYRLHNVYQRSSTIA